MSEWHLIIDVALCENCGNCQLAAKDEYVGNSFPGYTESQPRQGEGVVRIERHVRGSGSQMDVTYVPRLCNHCVDAPCMKAAPDAVRRRPDGIVIIDPVKAKGRREIVTACPYGAVIWNEELDLPQNWIFDAHLLDQGWQEPRCQQVCPTGAITAVKDDPEAMARRAVADNLQVLNPEFGTKPRIHYRNLARVTKAFVAGSLYAERDGLRDCVEGANVTLLNGSDTIGQAKSDAFGDFTFDGLTLMSGPYRLVAENDTGRTEIAVPVLDSALALGDIALPSR